MVNDSNNIDSNNIDSNIVNDSNIIDSNMVNDSNNIDSNIVNDSNTIDLNDININDSNFLSDTHTCVISTKYLGNIGPSDARCRPLAGMRSRGWPLPTAGCPRAPPRWQSPIGPPNA